MFLDILMKKLNGLETAKRFRFLDSNALLVFVTTESGYAVEGYDVEANGFLVKTFPPDVQAFGRLMDRLTAKLSNILFLDLTDTELELRIPVDMLQYIDVSDHRLYIHTPEKQYSLGMPLEKLKERLPQDGRFFQCHRGILVNLDRVSSLEKEVVILKKGGVLPVSGRNYHSFVTAQSTWNFRKLREQFL